MVRVKIADVAEFYGLGIAAPQTEVPVHLQDPVEGSSQATKTVMTWTEDQTRLLLNLYMQNMENIGPLKRFKNKKQMWESISNEIKTTFGVKFTTLQTENRFKNVAKKNKDVIKNNRTSGSSIMATPYDKEMGQIAALDDSIEPEVIMTPRFIQRKRPVETEPTSDTDTTITDTMDVPYSPPSKKTNNADIALQLLEAYKAECERKEERAKERARQHDEKMQKIDRLSMILEELSKKL